MTAEVMNILVVNASEAKQSRAKRKTLDCFVACAPRNDAGLIHGSKSLEYGFAFSRAKTPSDA